MKHLVAGILSLSMLTAAGPLTQAFADDGQTASLRKVSPALDAYTTKTLYGGVWQRGDLSARDRSIVTVASLIARGQAADMAAEFARALDNGVTPAELSETITHLAFYTGWPNAMAAVAVAEKAFAGRGISVDRLPAADPDLLPLDEAEEERRERFVQERFGDVSKGVVDNTRDLLFLDLWLRPALAPRDRSLVTVSALISTGKVEQMPFHLNKAMDNGLTRAEASEVLTHLAFYAGWPNVFSALPVAKDVFGKRGQE